jgi:2-oxo-4-hydroxy-4-carboxy-5-ureidoimidazoline decarboxylase
MNPILADWNRMEQEAAIHAILPCNGSRAWAAAVVNLRAFETPEQLFAASDTAWRGLPEADWQQAFDSHPRLGESNSTTATPQSLSWSAGEQSAANPDEAAKTALRDGNRAYEAKFGRTFVLCATGRSAAEMLARLNQRLNNDAASELSEAVEQQRLITQLRLRKWLQLPTAACAELTNAMIPQER